jgi:DNA-directed RNA polymerase III subunit RPC4
VSPGVATTFIQQLVHIDKHKKNATVLGEVNKSFVMTPDIDNLLDRLRLSDGTIPGEEKGPIKVEA